MHPDRVVLARDWKTLCDRPRRAVRQETHRVGSKAQWLSTRPCGQATKIELAIIYLVSGLTLLVEHHKKLCLPTLLGNRHM